MTQGDVLALLAALGCAILAGLLAAAESAVAGVSRVRVAELVFQGRRGARRLAMIVEDTASVVNSLLLTRLLFEVAAIVLVTTTFLDILAPQWWAVLASVLTMVLVSYVAVGVAPRTLGRQHAETYARLTSGPVRILSVLLGPITRLLILLGNAVTPGRGFKEGPFASEAELRELVDLAEKSSVIEHDERQMIHSVFELGDTIVRELMVPRPDMVVIERSRTLRQAMSLALRSGFSRIPVVGDTVDDVMGVVYLKDVARRIYEHRDGESVETVETVMRTALFVPDSKPAGDLLREMQARRTHVSIVVDEYGGTAGLVTIEDILEEIVGDITDEYDTARPEVEELPGGAVRLTARYSVWDFAERFGVRLDDEDEEDVETVGGLLAKRLGMVPIAGSTVEIDGWRLVAESLEGRRNRIGTVVVERVTEPADDESAEPGESDVEERADA